MVKKLAAVFGTLAALGIGLASIPQTICACGDASMAFTLAVSANPMKQDASHVRTKLLEQLPVGSSQPDIDRFLAGISSGDKIRLANCQHAAATRICRFPIRRSIWFEKGFEVRFRLDADSRLADARVVRFPAS